MMLKTLVSVVRDVLVRIVAKFIYDKIFKK